VLVSVCACVFAECEFFLASAFQLFAFNSAAKTTEFWHSRDLVARFIIIIIIIIFIKIILLSTAKTIILLCFHVVRRKCTPQSEGFCKGRKINYYHISTQFCVLYIVTNKAVDLFPIFTFSSSSPSRNLSKT